MKVLEIKGSKGYFALQSYNHLLMGLKMLPEYMGIQWEVFAAAFEKASEDERRKMLTHAANFVKLQPDEFEPLISLCADPNGVPYSKENIKNLTPDKFIDAIVAVTLAISNFKITLLSEDEKKNLKIAPLI